MFVIVTFSLSYPFHEGYTIFRDRSMYNDHDRSCNGKWSEALANYKASFIHPK